MENNRKHLPWETVEQILHNLPVKSLLRFKCVSKSWRSLISDKSFVKRHLEKSSTDERLTHHRIIVRSDYHGDSYYNLATCSLGTLFDERNEKCPTAVTTLKHCPIAKWCFGSRILGTCNGLILMFADTGHLFLWNPSIRDAENIPLASFDGRCDSSIREFIYGFGYDEANDDYKVVCFYIMYSKPFQTKIFSLRGKYWKKIENFENGFPYCGSSGKLVNGKLHWIAEDGCDWWDIVSFNFSDEKFEIVPRPRQYSNEYIRYFPKLVSLGGYLGFIGHEATIGTSVWVMMKYGEAESWTRVWMTRSSDDADSLWFTKNGDIAMAFESSDVVVVCNGEKTLRKFRVDVDDAEFVPKVYVESLVSPRIG